MSRIVAAIDYGTSKIACAVVRMQNTGAYDVLGYGSVPYAGYADGKWNEPDKLADVTKSCLHEAGIVAHRRIRSIYVAVPGDYTKVTNYRVRRDITAADRRVTRGDMEALLAMTPAPPETGEWTVLHRRPVYFTPDSQERMTDPLGERTSSLSALVTVVLANRTFLSHITNLMDYLGIEVKGFVSAIIGQAAFMIPNVEKQTGCVLVDTGFATTTVALLQGDGILYQETVSLGARQLVTDMMERMGVTYSEADAIKRRYVFGLDNDSGQMQLMSIMDRTDKARKYETALVTEVIESRMREILEKIADVIDTSGFRLANRSVVYLTGGGFAMMHGIRQFASSILHRNVQVLSPQSPRLNSSVYSGVLGVVDHIGVHRAARGGGFFSRKK